MQLKTITYQSSKIFYRIVGEGNPVVLLHGFGEDGDIWLQQIAFLQPHFKLIIPDLPGSGKSEMIDKAGIDEYALVIKALLDNEKIEECQIIGHSMGGYITLAFAGKYPSLLSSFGLFHSTAFADSEEKKTARLKSIEFIRQNSAYAFLKTMIPGLFTATWAANNQLQIDDLVEQGRNFSAEGLIQYYTAMIARPDRTVVLKNFPHPVLFIVGEHDNVIPYAQSLQQCHLPSQSYLCILRNSAHMGMWEETEKCNKALLEFLTRQPY